jgi:RES domain-containing protein
MHDLPSLKTALASAPVHVIKGKLTRLVPHLDLGGSPDWLFVSGKANRYNPNGFKCIYFGEATEVAQIEYEEGWKGHPGADQPVTTFHAEVSLKHTVDLTDPATLKKLKFTDKELFAKWKRVKRPTQTQLLGQALFETRWFSAIRFPSAAAVKRGTAGTNIVIFPDCLDKKDYVRILGPGGKTLQQWP